VGKIGVVTQGASRGLRFLAIFGTASKSQIFCVLLSESQMLLTSVDLKGGLEATLQYSIMFLPKEVMEECREAEVVMAVMHL